MRVQHIVMIALAFVFVSVAASGVTTVSTGHRGVKTTFGKVIGESLPEGIYFYNPFTTHIVEMDVREQKMESVADTYTRDVQQAKIGYALNYFLRKDYPHLMFQDVGDDWAAKLVPQVVEASLKAVIGKYDAVDLIGDRERATREAETAVRAVLAGKGIEIKRLELVNIDYENAFERAVEAKVIAIQKAAEALNNTKRIEEEAKQTVLTAKAAAEAMRIKANALTQNKALVDYEAVLRWNGKLPDTVMGGAIPFLNIGAR